MRSHLTALMLLVTSSSACVTTVERDALHFGQDVHRVEIDADAGDVEVSLESRSDVLVERTARYHRSRPDLQADLRDGVLTLSVRCPPMANQCSADHAVFLPASAEVVVVSGAGDVTVHGLDDAVDIDTQAGDVYVTALAGDLFVDSGAGDIVATGLTSPWVAVDTNAGDVELDLDRRAELVEVDTNAGDVTIDTPSGAYDLTTRTSAGDVTLRGVSRSSQGDVIDVHTEAGDILVRGR